MGKKKEKIEKLEKDVRHLSERIGQLIDALVDCRERFGEYRDLHAAKGTEDGAAKSQRNADMVSMIDQVLG